MTDILKIKTNEGWKGIAVVQGDEAQIQSDWAQDDNTERDYIKNKPAKLSDFTDDLGNSPSHTHNQYLTSHQDISGKQDVLSAGEGISISDNTISTKGITENISTVLGNTIELSYGYEIYKKIINENTTLNFDLTNLGTLTNKTATFELYLSMPSAYTVSFPNSVIWLVEPDLSESGNYLFVFRTFDSGATYLGNLEAKW